MYRKYGKLTETACRAVGYGLVGRMVERLSKLGNRFHQFPQNQTS